MAATGIEVQDHANTKTLRITDADTLETFDVLLFPETEPAALALAVSARTGVESATGFFLTAKSDPKSAVVPLSCSLADGASLVLHRIRPRQQRQQQPPQPAAVSHSDVRESAALATSTSTSSALSEPLLSRAASINGPPAAAPGGTPPPLRRGTTNMVSNQLEGLERLSRLTTDLANERTLLAWMRTCLAAIRTLFSYLALSATTAAWQMSIT